MCTSEERAAALFEEARLAGLLRLQERAGIGTLQERSLHAIFKYWLDPDESHHEVRLDGAVADIFDGERVTEIQTRNFSALRPKLEKLLEHHPVTVVHPITRHKTLVWVDPASGEMTPPRRSPKTGQWADAARELVYIRPLLTHPRLTVMLVQVDTKEYRLRDGWSADGKKGSHRVERLPTAIGPTLLLRERADYAALLPVGLPAVFTSTDVRRQGKLSEKATARLINTLYYIGAIQRSGKDGRRYTYQIAP